LNLKLSAIVGVPVTTEVLQSYAKKISGRDDLGDTWWRRFLNRHPDLRIILSHPMESARMKALNPTTVKEWFDLLKATITEYNIPTELIYNMDEKGLMLGVGGQVAVIVDRDQKSVNTPDDGNWELVTAIECVCADGSALTPCVIYKAGRRDLGWGDQNPGNFR
jgi:hypothetical protein